MAACCGFSLSLLSLSEGRIPILKNVTKTITALQSTIYPRAILMWVNEYSRKTIIKINTNTSRSTFMSFIPLVERQLSSHQHWLSADLLEEKREKKLNQLHTFFPKVNHCEWAAFSPLHVVTGTYVTRVYSLLGESSSSLRFLDSRTRILYGTFLCKIQQDRYGPSHTRSCLKKLNWSSRFVGSQQLL